MLQSHQSSLSMKENKTNMKAMRLMFLIILAIFHSQAKVALNFCILLIPKVIDSAPDHNTVKSY